MIEAIFIYGGVLLAVLSIIATVYYSEKKLPKFSTATESKIAISKDVPDGIPDRTAEKYLHEVCRKKASE